MKHVTRNLSTIGASVMAGLVLLIASPAGATANDGNPATPVICVMESSEVVGGLGVFTVGPENCTIQLGPVSFSTYYLPGGYAKPWAAQQLYAHSPENGRYYGPGTHQLSAPVGDTCNWQTDLYRGTGQSYAPHIHYLHGLNIGWDLNEGNVCDDDDETPAPPPSPQVPAALPPAPAEPAGAPGAPGPASAGHGVFDPANTGNGTTASTRPAPVIERTLSTSSAAASSSTSSWSTPATLLAATALASLLVGGIISQRRRFGSD